MAPRNAKSRTNLHFRPRAALTLQYFIRNFTVSNFQNHTKIDVGRCVVASRIERTQNAGFYDFLKASRPRFGANLRPRPIWTPKSAHAMHTPVGPGVVTVNFWPRRSRDPPIFWKIRANHIEIDPKSIYVHIF